MDALARRHALRSITNGLFVMVARAEEELAAATISWVTQVSFSPPLVAAALKADSRMLDCVRRGGRATLSVVGADQADVASRFFGRTEIGPDGINGVAVVETGIGVPAIACSPARIECSLTEILDPGGDHLVVVLEVTGADAQARVDALTVAASPWAYGG